jgi:hypothetical protein
VLCAFVGWPSIAALFLLLICNFFVNSLLLVFSVEAVLGYLAWLRAQQQSLLAPDPFYSRGGGQGRGAEGSLDHTEH